MYIEILMKLNSKRGKSESKKGIMDLKKMPVKIEYYEWLKEKFNELK